MKKCILSFGFVFMFLLSGLYAQNLTPREIWNEILKDSIKCPETVFKQYGLESGFGKSNYAKERHNLFGFKGTKGYMYFSSDSACIAYYSRWQKKHYTGGDYEWFLVNVHYATGWDYIYELRKIKLPQYCFYGRECGTITGCE